MTDVGATDRCELRVGSVSKVSCSCVVVSTLDCDDESPSTGLIRGSSIDGRRPSTRESECGVDEENGVDVGVSLTKPGRYRVVEPTARASVDRESSELKNAPVDVVSVMRGEGTGEE